MNSDLLRKKMQKIMDCGRTSRRAMSRLRILRESKLALCLLRRYEEYAEHICCLIFLQLDEWLLLSNSYKAKPLFNVADLFIVIFIVSRAFVTPASAMPPTVINILTLFEVSLQPFCSTGCDSGIFCTAAVHHCQNAFNGSAQQPKFATVVNPAPSQLCCSAS